MAGTRLRKKPSKRGQKKRSRRGWNRTNYSGHQIIIFPLDNAVGSPVCTTTPHALT